VLIPYPNEFPLEAFSLLLDRVRGKSIPISDLAHSAWNVAGYCLSQMLPAGPMISSALTVESEIASKYLDFNDVKLLEYAIENGYNPPSEDGVSRGVIPWMSIFLLAIKLLRQLNV
jgi:hypothetical protein